MQQEIDFCYNKHLYINCIVIFCPIRGDNLGGYVVSSTKKQSSTTRPVNDGPSAPAPTPWLSAGKSSTHSAQTRGKTTPSIPTTKKLDNDYMEISATPQTTGNDVYEAQTWQVIRNLAFLFTNIYNIFD